MTMEVEVAQWGDLTYFLSQNPTTNQFEVTVVDEKKNKSIFNFDDGHEKNGNLNSEDRLLAQRMIRDCHEEFLEYWKKITQK
ncbi:MAG: hypothetical protein H0V82_00950 [Candidatus Protochlamydia sp.]|nr:hypothetical protein [Candidatus Protochlamydia sp.]